MTINTQIQIIGQPSFRFHITRAFALLMQKVCKAHYSGDVKEMAYACDAGVVNGWVNLTAPVPDGGSAADDQFVVVVTFRQADKLTKALEMLYNMRHTFLEEHEFQDLKAFGTMLHRAFAAVPGPGVWEKDVP